MYDNIVIGGGASALSFASFINKSQKTLLLEQNEKLAKKLLISGGGRCNFTNKKITPKDYYGNCPFLKELFKQYGNRWLLRFLTKNGLHYSLKNEVQYFCDKSSKEILAIWLKEAKNVESKLNCKVLDVQKNSDFFLLISSCGTFKSKRLIVASGGVSYPQIGVSDIAKTIAEKFNIQFIDFKPALVGLTLQKEQQFFKNLSGISLLANVQVASHQFSDYILFAHKGVSGPAILNASLFWEKGKIVIDFLPNKEIDFTKNKVISNALPLPKRFVKAFLEHLGLEDKKINALNRIEKEKLQVLKNYSFAPAGTFGFKKAEVCKGGVACSEMTQNFETKKQKGLFFIGEALEVTGRLGGFNLQFAFSSGAKCANFINNIN